MLLKISLGLSILVSLATLYFAQFPVRERIESLSSEVTAKSAEVATANQAETAAKSETKKVKTELESYAKLLENATNGLAVATKIATEQQDRANKAAEALKKETVEKTVAQEELAQWKSIGLQIDQIRAQRDELAKAKKEKEVFVDENKVLLTQKRVLETELARYQGDGEKEVTMEAGRRGKVVAIDPKYAFVVIDIGEKQGIVENAKMLVSRDGKLIAKIKITSVQAGRAIANVLTEWKQAEIMEGDLVLN